MAVREGGGNNEPRTVLAQPVLKTAPPQFVAQAETVAVREGGGNNETVPAQFVAEDCASTVRGAGAVNVFQTAPAQFVAQAETGSAAPGLSALVPSGEHLSPEGPQILNMIGDISGPAPQQRHQQGGAGSSSSLGAVGPGIEGEDSISPTRGGSGGVRDRVIERDPGGGLRYRTNSGGGRTDSLDAGEPLPGGGLLGQNQQVVNEDVENAQGG